MALSWKQDAAVVKLPNSGKKSSFELLLQMGFARNRAQKAITSTADKGVQVATDWLLSHVNDPTLDLESCREYILYLCPVGELQHQLDQFWLNSFKECGWNQARNYFPHMTMTTFFEVKDDAIELLCSAMEDTCKTVKNIPKVLKLDFFNSDNFIGLFMNEETVPFAKELIMTFSEQARKHGIAVPVYKKEHHLSLAYKFLSDQKADVTKLTTMAKQIDLAGDVRWDLRLYSRDARSKNCNTYKVTTQHTSRCPGELDLEPNDYIFVSEDATPMGDWRIGTSWRTGVTAKFPLPYTVRAPETDTWILHKSIPLIGGSSASNCDNTPIYSQVDKGKRKPRTVYIMRHGERVDFTFSNWMNWSFDRNGKYVRTNLNLPKTLPKRHGGAANFSRDCPLTELGKFQALNTGEYMKHIGIKIDCIYTSPSLRCIETSAKFLEGYGATDLPLRVEPGLFEWLGWYKPTIPEFLTLDELMDNGFKVNRSYEPVWDDSQFDIYENIEMYYNRCHLTTELILEKYHKNSGNVLLVGHAATLDVCSRQILNKPPRPSSHFQKLLMHIPYCSMATIKETEDLSHWDLVQPPIPCFQNSFNAYYDWQLLF
ncbi:ecdysteroid-phosphate phosphatase-like isoform X2 [Tubulanus polymorphus]|uniref:ecdysteroid-phosphate phosphatase-like isoform X2 n=1 Tax=Tubulanus polymorphus TaxID=672921 RepID=UPI003DA4ECF3